MRVSPRTHSTALYNELQKQDTSVLNLIRTQARFRYTRVSVAHVPKPYPILQQNRTGGRGDWTRTSDPLHPMQVRYQTAPHPDL